MWLVNTWWNHMCSQGFLTSAKIIGLLWTSSTGITWYHFCTPTSWNLLPSRWGSCIVFQCRSGLSDSAVSVMDFSCGANPWLPRSSGLTPFYFFVCGFLKQDVYRTKIASLQDLSSRLDAAVIKLKNVFSITANAVVLRKSARTCIKCGGGQFQQRL